MEQFIDVLNTPIQNLPVQHEFKTMALTNGFDTINQLLAFPVSSLLVRENFSMHVYSELIKRS